MWVYWALFRSISICYSKKFQVATAYIVNTSTLRRECQGKCILILFVQHTIAKRPEQERHWFWCDNLFSSSLVSYNTSSTQAYNTVGSGDLFFFFLYHSLVCFACLLGSLHRQHKRLGVRTSSAILVSIPDQTNVPWCLMVQERQMPSEGECRAPWPGNSRVLVH